MSILKDNKLRAIYPGTFDPITNGHIDIIERSIPIFDEIIVLVAHSERKKPLFDAEERKDLIEKCFLNQPKVRVEVYDGLLAEFAKRHHIRILLRGLRAVSDFEYEFQMGTMNRHLSPELETFFLMSSEKVFFVNSTVIKEVMSHGGNVSEFVPPHVEIKLKEKLC